MVTRCEQYPAGRAGKRGLPEPSDSTVIRCAGPVTGRKPGSGPGLLVIFLTAGPMAALAVGQWTAHPAGTGTSGQPHSVQAVLLQPATAPAGPAAAALGAQVWVRARWESAGGSARTGEVRAPAGAPAGTAVTVWLNASGRVTGPPQRGEFAFAAVITAVMTLAVTALALLVVLRLIQCFLNCRRLAAWEAAWRATGPRWTGHRS